MNIKEQAQLVPLVVSGKLRLGFFFFIINVDDDDELTTSRRWCVVRCLGPTATVAHHEMRSCKRHSIEQ